MDLYIAIGVPPYNKLLSGKLIALVSITNEIRDIIIHLSHFIPSILLKFNNYIIVVVSLLIRSNNGLQITIS